MDLNKTVLKQNHSEKKALIAMSGGVDSSVAALMMQEEGYACMGVTMKLYETKEEETIGRQTCCALSDVEDARSVACHLGMPYYVFNMKVEFKTHVVDRFVEDYENGRTPNPCINCNRYLKFESLYRRAAELGCDFIVTGHYARIGYDEKIGRYQLKKAVDESKDQSYVLYSLTQEQLAHTAFPLGAFTKTEIRKIAEYHNLGNANKRESQDICFIPDGNYAKFIREYTGKKYPLGDFKDFDGKVLGQHRGIINYTIGQRKGLGIASTQPLYVCQINLTDNEILLGEKDQLSCKTLLAKDFNWISIARPTEEISVMARTRYHQEERQATARVKADGNVEISFADPAGAVAPGQAIVLYQGDLVLGGGTIFEIYS
ncbi:MAG: tRNA 2-thiouridine(34) synthase MnmA [Lachnospiraceae bacterium]|nr:tRNA 2-thiouridine(34) synthase MnmA [Lachnospiraceae bacterium]